MSIDVYVIGEGPTIGDKAAQLMAKTSSLGEVGFSTPPRVVFPYEFFLPLLERVGVDASGGYRKGLERKIASARFSGEESSIISWGVLEHGYDSGFSMEVSRALGECHNGLMMVRSSGVGDAVGNGVYESHIGFDSLESIEANMLQVLASHFSEQGFVFRQRTRAKGGMGIIVENFVCRELCHGATDMYGNRYFFGPLVSGHGYTSTQKGEGYAAIVPGFGGGVSASLVEIVAESALKPFGGNFSKYVDRKMKDSNHRAQHPEAVFSGVHNRRLDAGYFLPMTTVMFNGFDRTWQVLEAERYREAIPPVSGGNLHPLSWWDWMKGKMVYNKESQAQLEALNLSPLFEGMKEMERRFGPQYFEFAVAYRDGEPRFWITQIANATISKPVAIPNIPAFFSATNVINSGSGSVDNLVYIHSLEDIQKVKDAGDGLGTIGIVYRSGLPQREVQQEMMRLQNMVLALEKSNRHGSPSLYVHGHLASHMKVVGSFFGVLDNNNHNYDTWREFEKGLVRRNGVQVYGGPFRIYANEGRGAGDSGGKLVVQKMAKQ